MTTNDTGDKPYKSDDPIPTLKEVADSFSLDLQAKFKQLRGPDYDYGFGFDYQHLGAVLSVYTQRFLDNNYSTSARHLPEGVNGRNATEADWAFARDKQKEMYLDFIARFDKFAAGDMTDKDDEVKQLFKDFSDNLFSMWD
jgi:hypothetical protein